MTGASRPGVAPPPSVDDVLSALTDDGRIGQVDFATAPVRPRVGAPEVAAEPEPAPVTVLAPAAEDRVVDLARTVEEVAAEVIGRMRAAEEATLRHLEAMELEAARRYELVTAQAELDAELIRLQSRREAHAIVTAARMRAGEIAGSDDDPDDDPGDDPDEHGRRLSLFSDAVTRVADATDSVLGSGRGNGL